MSKGNPIVKARMERALVKEVLECIRRRNIYTVNEPWVLSDFIKAAVVEKLRHMHRSRTKKRRKTKRKDSAA